MFSVFALTARVALNPSGVIVHHRSCQGQGFGSLALPVALLLSLFLWIVQHRSCQGVWFSVWD